MNRNLYEYSKLIGPHQMAFDITNRCNLRCLHCYNDSGENFVCNEELSDEEVLKFIDEIAKLKLFNICFCGGETLLRKDLIIECSKRLKSGGISNISLVSNGLLMTEEIAKQLKEAGINKIQISLDGAKPTSHDKLRNKEGSYEKAINAIKALVKVGIDTGVAFTPTSFNISEIREVHSILNEIGIKNEGLRTQPLMLLGRANDHIASLQPTDIQYRKFIKEINSINSERKTPFIKWGDPVDHLIRFRKNRCDINNWTVRANGDIVLSPYIPLVIGNIRKHTFNEYWKYGLAKAWNYKIPKYFANKISCIQDMNKTHDELPTVWKERDIYIDLIDNDLDNLDALLNDKVINCI